MPAPWPIVFWIVSLITGVAGVAGWILGAGRKSAAEARDADISALERRVTNLSQDNKLLHDQLLTKSAALDAIIAEIMGKAELEKIVRELTELAELLRLRTARFDRIDNDHAFLIAMLAERKDG